MHLIAVCENNCVLVDRAVGVGVGDWCMLTVIYIFYIYMCVTTEMCKCAHAFTHVGNMGKGWVGCRFGSDCSYLLFSALTVALQHWITVLSCRVSLEKQETLTPTCSSFSVIEGMILHLQMHKIKTSAWHTWMLSRWSVSYDIRGLSKPKFKFVHWTHSPCLNRDWET